jgi:hypothetical protein
MFHSIKGFFNRHIVRKVLSAFWLSIREIFFNLRLQNLKKLGSIDETILKNNFYMRLEFSARGREIFEPVVLEQTISAQETCRDEGGLFPLHSAIFDSNLRKLSKALKQDIDGVFYTHKNLIDPCGNTPLMLAVKLANIDAVKILTDMYTCPKMRPLNDLMNAKEIAIAMKHS